MDYYEALFDMWFAQWREDNPGHQVDTEQLASAAWRAGRVQALRCRNNGAEMFTEEEYALAGPRAYPEVTPSPLNPVIPHESTKAEYYPVGDHYDLAFAPKSPRFYDLLRRLGIEVTSGPVKVVEILEAIVKRIT